MGWRGPQVQPPAPRRSSAQAIRGHSEGSSGPALGGRCPDQGLCADGTAYVRAPGLPGFPMSAAHEPPGASVCLEMGVIDLLGHRARPRAPGPPSMPL